MKFSYIGKLLTVCLFLFSCKNQSSIESSSDDISVIAVGSCNKMSIDQSIWDNIELQLPDLFVWLGDIIYGDTDDMEVLRGKYNALKTHPEYVDFLSKTKVIGVWDDHDYGLNDGGKEFLMKKESRDVLLEFLDVPADDDIWKREGAYSSYELGSGSKKVKLILLDARYFRDELKDATNPDLRYEPNPVGDILGEEQWSWLEDELRNSDAEVHIIGNGIQVIPEDHGFEKWANLPLARNRLFDLIQEIKPRNTILLSGDRHISEISKIDLPDLDYPLYELTASGMTHTWREAWEEVNQHRIGDHVRARNYGLVKIDWSKEPLEITFEIRGLENTLYKAEKLLL